MKTYRIGEFSKIIGISSRNLRYYEDLNLIFPDRDEGNQRIYTEDHIIWVKFLIYLKRTGLTLEEMQSYVTFRAKGKDTIADRIELLEKRRDAQLIELEKTQQSLDVISAKIDWYKRIQDGHNEKFADYLEERKINY